MHAESQWLNSKLNRKDDLRMDPKKNFKGQPMFNADAATSTDEQSDEQRNKAQEQSTEREGQIPVRFPGVHARSNNATGAVLCSAVQQ